jgi:hypothetical protein
LIPRAAGQCGTRNSATEYLEHLFNQPAQAVPLHGLDEEAVIGQRCDGIVKLSIEVEQMRSAHCLRASHERGMRSPDTMECCRIDPEAVEQNAVRLKRAAEIVAVAQGYFVVHGRQEYPAMALVHADDAFLAHSFEDAQQRAAIGIAAGHLGDALGDPPADPIATTRQ